MPHLSGANAGKTARTPFSDPTVHHVYSDGRKSLERYSGVTLEKNKETRNVYKTSTGTLYGVLIRGDGKRKMLYEGESEFARKLAFEEEIEKWLNKGWKITDVEY